MKKNFIKLLLFIGMLFIGLSTAYAEDKPFTFSIGGADNVKPGDEFDVEVKVTGPNDTYTLTSCDLNVTYDTSKLTILGGSQVVVSEPITESRTLATIKFRVNNDAAAGNATVNLEANSVIRDGVEVKGKKGMVSFNAGTVSIRAIESDSSLKSLKIPNTVLSPEFNKNVHDYTATVTDVTSVDIKAVAEGSHSTVSVTENSRSLVKGENDITVVCKAENGSETWYTIKVTLNVTPTEEELKAQDATLKNIVIKGQKLEFSSTEKKYYINVDYDTKKLEIEAIPNVAEAEVVITGNTKLVVGKNTVKINVTSTDKSKTETYQIIVTRVDEDKEIVQTCPDTTSKMEWIIFSVSLFFTFTLGIVLGYFLCRTEILRKIFKKKPKKEEAPVEIETLSDTIDLSDTVKQASKAAKEQLKKENKK